MRTSIDCTCYDLPEPRVSAVTDPRRAELGLLGVRDEYVRGGGTTAYSVHRRLYLVGNRVVEKVSYHRLQIGPGPRPGARSGHVRTCPLYVAPLAHVSKKKRRRERALAWMEDDLRWRNAWWPSQKPRRANIKPALSQRGRKIIQAHLANQRTRRRYSGLSAATAEARAAWGYKPFEPKPVKRREKRGQTRPR